MKTHLSLLFCGMFIMPLFLFSQQSQFHQGLKIEAIPSGKNFKFRIANPPKLGAVTKNQPYLSYFWDFGDGGFKRGTMNEPEHGYAKAGTYQVRVLVFTGNTLDLVEQPQPISVNASASSSAESPSQTANLALIGSHYREELRPSEDLIIAVGTKGATGGGKLYVFFNEKQHKGVKPLEYKGQTNYFGEKEGADNQNLPEIATGKSLFNDVKIFDLPKTDPSVSNLFLTFKQVSNITNKLKGNKVWTHAVFVANGKADKADLTLNVVPSHDPNDIDVSPSYLGFRGINKRDFTYRVRFENTAQGVAKSVGVKIFKPIQADTNRIEWLDFSPKCAECPQNVPLDSIPYSCFRRINTGQYAEILFHNAQLAGKTKGMIDKDLNDGFVRYKLYPMQKGLKKLPLESRAIVTFDGEEMKTNNAKATFKRGLWLGAKLGTNYDFLSKKNNYFVGLTLSPYREVKPYFQVEAMMDVNKLVRQELYTGDSTRTQISNQICEDCAVDTLTRFTDNVKQSTLNLVPLQIRWDLSKVLSIGVGSSMDIYFRTVEGSKQSITHKVTSGNCSTDEVLSQPTTYTKKETTFKFAVFGDIQVGFDQFKLGARYIYPFDKVKKADYMQLYVAYKF